MSVQGEQLPVPAATEHEIEQVLLGLADGSYVLSTPDGSVAECGVGVVALLGAAAEQLVGRPTVDVLLADAGEQQRAVFGRLAQSSAADPSMQQTFRTTTADGSNRVLRFVVIAVPLALGWEFTSLLGELGARDTGTWEPEALRTRHGRALDAIESVCAHGAQPEPGARLAGILIIVRDVEAGPLAREDVGRRMTEHRAAQRAAAAEAARRADALVGRSPSDEAVFEAGPELCNEGGDERIRVLAERLEAVQRDATSAISVRDEALATLAQARSQLQAECERREAAEVQLLAGREQIEAARGEVSAAGGEASTARAEADAARNDLALVQAQVETARAQAHAAELELAGERERAEAARGEIERVRAELHQTRTSALSRSADEEALRSELESARRELGAMSTGLRSANERLQEVERELDDMRDELQEAQAALIGARAEAEVTAAQLGAARRASEAMRVELAQSSPDGPLARPSQPVPATTYGEPDPPPCAAGEAAALIGLDGMFKRLDAEFCRLLGCSEAELRSARWPSVIDRENLSAHQEIARALRAGEIESAEVETIYMHAQGLLVPIEGRVSMFRDAAGAPSHYLFAADVSRTSGVPSGTGVGARY